jgi:N-acetylmuramoyl-L-alanine amidase
VKIQERYLTPNIFSRSGRPLASVRGIVVHWVANPGSSAIANRNYFESLKDQPQANQGQRRMGRYASAHFIVGLESEVIQCLLETEMAYHVGGTWYAPLALKRLSAYPNNCTLGIELCHPTELDEAGNKIKDGALWRGEFLPATLDAAAELIKELLERYSLGKDDIYRHYDITGKNCPRYFVKNEEKWIEFVNGIGNGGNG